MAQFDNPTYHTNTSTYQTWSHNFPVPAAVGAQTFPILVSKGFRGISVQAAGLQATKKVFLDVSLDDGTNWTPVLELTAGTTPVLGNYELAGYAQSIRLRVEATNAPGMVAVTLADNVFYTGRRAGQ